MTTTREYHRTRPTTTRRRRPPSSARDRGRLLFDLRGNYAIVADDLETERELMELAERITAALLEHVRGAA